MIKQLFFNTLKEDYITIIIASTLGGFVFYISGNWQGGIFGLILGFISMTLLLMFKKYNNKNGIQ